MTPFTVLAMPPEMEQALGVAVWSRENSGSLGEGAKPKEGVDVPHHKDL